MNQFSKIQWFLYDVVIRVFSILMFFLELGLEVFVAVHEEWKLAKTKGISEVAWFVAICCIWIFVLILAFAGIPSICNSVYEYIMIEQGDLHRRIRQVIFVCASVLIIYLLSKPKKSKEKKSKD